jgi:DNA-binding transcriptional MerR regulator
MARKRSAGTRARERFRRRPKTPAPTDGFFIRDVARLTGISVRTLRDYVQRGLLRHSALRGTLTRYPRREVIRLFAALSLRAQSKTTWAEVKRQLAPLTDARLETWLAERPLPPGVATELGLSKMPNELPNIDQAAATQRAGDCWHRVVLLPGLELFVSGTASPLVWQTALRCVELASQGDSNGVGHLPPASSRGSST